MLPVTVGVDTEPIVDLLLVEKLWIEVVYHGQDVPEKLIDDQGVVGDGTALDEVPLRGPPQISR